MSTSPNQIAAVVVTYRRDAELARLLQSLEASSLVPTLIVIVDHAALTSTAGLIAKFHLNTHYIAVRENPGPGAGWKLGMETAFIRQPGTTHFLILDDDVVLPPQAVAELVKASANAAITCPMLLDDSEKIWAFPEPQQPFLRKKIREIHTAAESISVLGTEPLPFVWCTGACVLVRRNIVEAVGFHRTDFWMLGEDLEYSMRVAAHGGGVFLPNVFVPHLPPPSTDSAAAAVANRRKFDSLLQNLAYLSFHHPNSGHLRHYVAGNVRRYFRTFGWKISSLAHIVGCLWRGAVLGRPFGSGK